MKTGSIGALIVGKGQFIEKKLEERLISNGIEVSFFDDSLDIFDNHFLYVFDFVGNGEVWNKINHSNTKLVLINVDDNLPWKNTSEILSQFKINWRIINTHGVYGPGMSESGFITSAFRQAVENKNLILPSLSIYFRLLWVGDLVEVILRSVFLSGTEHEEFLVVGEKYNAKDIAEVLIDEAKMTRHKVMQSEIHVKRWQDDEVSKNRDKLRWLPEVSFKIGAKETLQYFFTKIEEERKEEKKIKSHVNVKAKLINNYIETENLGEKENVNKSERKRVYEVYIEENIPETKNEEKNINHEIIVVDKNNNLEEEKKWKIAEEVKSEIPEKKEEVENMEDDFSEIKHFKEWKLNNEKKEKIIIDGDMSNEIPEVVRKEKVIEKVVSVEKENLKIEKSFVFDNYFKKNKKEKKIIKNKKIKWFIFGITLALFILFLYPTSWIITGVNSVKTIKNTEVLIKNGEYDLALKKLEKSSLKLKNIEEKIDDVGLNKTNIFRNFQSLLRVLDDAIKLEIKVVGFIDDGKLFNEALFKERDIDWFKEIKSTTIKVDEIISDIGVLRARLDGNWSWAPGIVRNNLQKQAKKIDEVRVDVDILKNAILMLPEIVGANGERKDYLVLFQNENELRTSGGFIGSFAVLSFKNGKMLNLEVKDVYEVDGQLKGHVEPPEEIKSHLGEAGWFLRDANWQASFPMAAKDIQWFFEKETNRKIDGVIGINLAVVKMMLNATGEISVPDYKEKINKENLYEQAEFYTETKFFPGSAQKASFLGGLSTQLFEEIKILDASGQAKLLTGMLDMLEQNEIQVQMNNNEIANSLSKLGWDGSIYQGQCGSERCYSDYLFVVESNFGVNKANYFINRNTEQQINISNNSVERVLKINFENTAKTTAWPGGDYKNYLRVYIPNDAMLGEIKVLEPNSKQVKIYGQNEIKIKDYEGKKEIGFLMVVPVNSKRIVEIRYSSLININNLDKFSYLSYIQKQSGVFNNNYVGLVSFPLGWGPMQVQPEAEVINKKILFNQLLNKDLKLGVELGK